MVMNTPQRIFYGCIESGTIWDGEQQARDYHAKAQYPDYPIIEMVEKTPLVDAAPELLQALRDLVDTVRSCAGCTDFGSYDAEDDFGVIEAEAAIAKALRKNP